MNNLSDIASGEISNKLTDLNSEKITDEVIGYWVEEGEQMGEIYAHVVFLMAPLNKNDDYNTSIVDDACTIAADRLSGLVTHTYCWFRTQEQFEKDFSNAISFKIAA